MVHSIQETGTYTYLLSLPTHMDYNCIANIGKNIGRRRITLRTYNFDDHNTQKHTYIRQRITKNI